MAASLSGGLQMNSGLIMMGGTRWWRSWVEAPFGKVFPSAVWSAGGISCGGFATCSFHCCANERCVHAFGQSAGGVVQHCRANVPAKTLWLLLPLSVGKSSTDWLQFSSNLLLGFKLFTELSSGFQLLCISNTPNQLFVKFEIQDILIGHIALKE